MSSQLCSPTQNPNTLTFKRLHPTFAVEVGGIDRTNPIPDSVIREIVFATNREGVLVFRGAKLNDEQHIAFSRQLGELDDVNVLIKAGVQVRLLTFPI